MRRAAKVDANQPEIVRLLRQMGATVQSLAAVGDGCPDLAVGFQHRNYFLEIKDPLKSASRRTLTREQLIWHRDWHGQVDTVLTIEQAIEVICGR